MRNLRVGPHNCIRKRNRLTYTHTYASSHVDPTLHDPLPRFPFSNYLENVNLVTDLPLSVQVPCLPIPVN